MVWRYARLTLAGRISLLQPPIICHDDRLIVAGWLVGKTDIFMAASKAFGPVTPRRPRDSWVVLPKPRKGKRFIRIHLKVIKQEPRRPSGPDPSPIFFNYVFYRARDMAYDSRIQYS